MTVQIHDTLAYLGRQWTVLGVDVGPVFDLFSLGIRPNVGVPACWDGHCCAFAVRDGSLRLTRLDVWIAEEIDDGVNVLRKPLPPERLTTIGGVRPRATDELAMCWRWDGLDLPVPFSGRMLIGRIGVWPLSTREMMHRAWRFLIVRSLQLEAGRVVASRGMSLKAARARWRRFTAMLTSNEQRLNEADRMIAEAFGGALVARYRSHRSDPIEGHATGPLSGSDR